MHKFRIPRLVIAAAVAILSACAIGCLCFFQVRVTDNNLSPQLQNGDRVMINRLTPLDRGQIVVYINPLSSSKFSYGLGKCLALAGDTLRLFMKDVTSNSHSKHNYAWHDIIVPSKNTPVKVTRWNKKLLSNALFSYEGANVCSKCDSVLVVNGIPKQEVVFSHDFVWVCARNSHTISDSRLFGFLPTDNILGNASFISYSIQEGYSIPLSRIFKKLDD